MINIMYRKELLFLQHQSTQIGRGMGQVSVLLVGSSGVGKSSTVNHLFDLDEKASIHFAKTNSSISETRRTTEYVLRVDEPEYEVKGLELGLVDSPGFNDTDGTHWAKTTNFGSSRHPRYFRVSVGIWMSMC